jgi:hypothetical protein
MLLRQLAKRLIVSIVKADAKTRDFPVDPGSRHMRYSMVYFAP